MEGVVGGWPGLGAVSNEEMTHFLMEGVAGGWSGLRAVSNDEMTHFLRVWVENEKYHCPCHSLFQHHLGSEVTFASSLCHFPVHSYLVSNWSS
jgi:hypothetical protein